jgi:hypothetical protein
MLRLQHAANRSKWISSFECALFVHGEQTHWISHNELPMFLIRPLYQISECKRFLSGAETRLTKAATSVDITCSNAAQLATLHNSPANARRWRTQRPPWT